MNRYLVPIKSRQQNLNLSCNLVFDHNAIAAVCLPLTTKTSGHFLGSKSILPDIDTLLTEEKNVDTFPTVTQFNLIYFL